MSYGIDTIKVGYEVDPILIDFVDWTRTEKTKIGSPENLPIKDILMKKLRSKNDTHMCLKYISENYRKKQSNLLLIEFSLPKLVHGHNYLDITDIDAAADLANEAIAEIPGIPPLPDIRSAILHRIDLCANFQVGDDVVDYIQALGRAYMAHRTAKCYTDHGVCFNSREISTKFYDKEKECNSKAAYGILRFEISILKQRKVSSILGNSHNTLGTITFEQIHECIQNELKKLHLDKPILSDRSKVESILASVYESRAKVTKLVGHWCNRQTMTREQMLRKGYTKNIINDYEMELIKAGISVTGNMGTKELPALIPMLEDMKYFFPETKICHKVLEIDRDYPSDTRIIALEPIEA